MALSGIGNNIDNGAAVTQIAQLVGGKKGCACEIGFHPQNPVKLNGVANGLMDL